MKCLALASILAVGLLGCSGDDGEEALEAPSTTSSVTTSTTAASGCAITTVEMTIGEPHGYEPECWATILETITAGHGVEVDPEIAPIQAEALCRRLDLDPTSGLLTTLTDWETGAAPRPTLDADDDADFIPLAVAVYCPEHYDALRSAG